MKNTVLLFLLTLFSVFTYAQDEFITVWKPSNTQVIPLSTNLVSSNTQIYLPIRGTNYTVFWEEIGYPSHQATLTNLSSTVNTLIEFGTPLNPNPVNATYRVKVKKGAGSYDTVRFVDTSLYNASSGIVGDTDKILLIEQWGTTSWSTMREAFTMCKILDITATDIPNLSAVTDMFGTFSNCYALQGNSSFNNWDVSHVTNMMTTFGACFLFNQPIGNWDVSSVTLTHSMFSFATSFNQPLADWDTSNVEDATAMFFHADSFNQPIGNWDFSKNIGLENMFAYTNFNHPIGDWDTSEVVAMHHMFFNNPSFNQNIGNWNTANVGETDSMFENATSFNQDLGNWNLNSLLSAQSMFLNSGIDCVNYGKIIKGWAENTNTPNNINLGSVVPAFYDPQLVPQRNILTSKGWTITGDYALECTLSTAETSIYSIQIYPNPAHDFIYVKNLNGKHSYKIFDQAGRLILKGDVLKEKIDIQNLISGQYILQIESKKEIKNLKFIKK
ncbi:BspA family leucine-rich repeat surface protein [Chryseobacterium sp.]|uniref:BspA family leucine-rich repeat surface protein n=1 Tax=Chryseobacterium sp. TaxID=1871047 RepID=UPI00289B85EC|nr:BspA family leucine-rich repeat surface protein [Chryseobacterium sp.]